MSSAPVIVTKDLNFSYGEIPILSDINLTVYKGDCVSIVGPNGGGKTTLLKLFLGLLKPISGNVRVFDKPPSQVKSRIGYMPQYMRRMDMRLSYMPHYMRMLFYKW